ncbi:glycoside hydrolase family 6 protein [Streptomyces sp. NPDC047071]|uniref:glycoside hydrolase family 6 protein n=1 Tax=Streptomyces sp. NPDC047071 TaxID=3154808 RepID=UPI003452E76A
MGETRARGRGGRWRGLGGLTATAALVVAATGVLAGAVTVAGDDGPGRTEAVEGPRSGPAPSEHAASARPSRPGGGAAAGAGRLYRYEGAQVVAWVRAHRDDPRSRLIASRIAARPAAVWFTDPRPWAVTAQVRAVTERAGDRIPVLVAYAIPNRDCGGASRGGVPRLAAYARWIERFAAGLGSRAAVVILEPDAVALADCLSPGERARRFAALARAGAVLKRANPAARVYYDGGHSGWHRAERQAAALRRAGAASPASSDGVFTNVSNFHRTAAEVAYARRVLTALGGPRGLGAVIDTSRNGNGAPADGRWCDPAGRRVGRPPTLRTGAARIDAYLWVKLPGESDGCRGRPGTFSPGYAYDLARG